MAIWRRILECLVGLHSHIVIYLARETNVVHSHISLVNIYFQMIYEETELG